MPLYRTAYVLIKMYTGTVPYGIETRKFTVQFSCEYLELVGIPFGEIRRKRALSERLLFSFKKEKKKKRKVRNILVKTKLKSVRHSNKTHACISLFLLPI